MSVLVVIENPEECPLTFPDVDPISARTYLTDNSYSDLRGVKVFNICRSYRYQSIGYYVSLLAEARNHKPLPGITTIQDMKSAGIIRMVSEELKEVIQRAFGDKISNKYAINIYFGKCPDKQYDVLASRLFKYFPAAFIRADFAQGAEWQLTKVAPLPVKEIPVEEQAFAQTTASAYFAGKKLYIPKRTLPRYDLAILQNPDEEFAPSDPKALKRFIKAADDLGIGVELITRDDANSLSEFDALFIRETTNVDHHTYRMARKAMAEGLVVIDSPESILRCSNKVYLAELLNRSKLPTPRTWILHSKNLDPLPEQVTYPCILKQPDSSFSQGVVMAENQNALLEKAKNLLKRSELVIAQEFMRSDFDWRVGIIDRTPLFVCKYFMANKHWQIMRKDKNGRTIYGKSETLDVSAAPKNVVNAGLKAANLIGDGLYGVDLKQVGGKAFIIEVNDNPNVDAGIEDDVLGDELYRRIMTVFLKRIEARKAGNQIIS